MASGMAKKARSTSTVGSSRTCSDRGSGKNKYGNGVPSIEDRVCAMKPICYRGR